MPDRPIRLLIVSPSYAGFGGIESFIFALAEQMSADIRFEVRVVLKLVANQTITATLLEIIAQQQFPVQIVSRGSLALAKAILWADVVHAQNASPDICLLAKLFGKPLLLTIHNNIYNRTGYHVVAWRLMNRLADVRLYNSNFVKRSWDDKRDSSCSAVVPTVSKLCWDFAPFEQRHGFIFISRWIENKGADDLLEAYCQARLDPGEWPLVLVGDGPLLEPLHRKYGDRPGVTFHGFTSHATKIALISRAKWLVAPPRTKEDMGLTPIEARAMGIPCIVTNDGGLPEVAGNGALISSPGDVRGLASNLHLASKIPESQYRNSSLTTYKALSEQLRSPAWYGDLFECLHRRTQAPLNSIANKPLETSILMPNDQEESHSKGK